MTEPSETYRVRWQANGRSDALLAAEVVARIRAGRIGDGDRIARPDGVFVRWWEIPRFAALRRAPGDGAPAAAQAAAAPSVEGPAAYQTPSIAMSSVPFAATPAGDVGSSAAVGRTTMSPPAAASSAPQSGSSSAGPRAAISPEAALRAAAGRVEKQRSVDETLQRLQRTSAPNRAVSSTRGVVSGAVVALNAAGTTISACAVWESWLADGPEAVRDTMMQLSVDDILGVPETSSVRMIQDAYERRKATIDSAWENDSNALKLQSSRVAHFDLQRILAASLKVLTNAEDRALYERKLVALKRAPRLDEVLRFSISSTDEDVDPSRMSSEDEAVLKFAGFDTQKLRDAQPVEDRRATSTLAPNPPGPKRQMVLGIGLAVAVAVALFSMLPECGRGGEGSTEGEFRSVDP